MGHSRANRGSHVENRARALRVAEIMNDFRTLQHHIESLTQRPEARPTRQEDLYIGGYVILRQCAADTQALLARPVDLGVIGAEPSRVPDTEVQKATLQRYQTPNFAQKVVTDSWQDHS